MWIDPQNAVSNEQHDTVQDLQTSFRSEGVMKIFDIKKYHKFLKLQK
jgi:hypothetical protein